MNANAPIRVTAWGENRHEQINAKVREIYPDGMHETIAAGLRALLGEEAAVTTHVLDEPEHGLTEGVLAETDVLLWWGHIARRWDHDVDGFVDVATGERVSAS